MRADTTRRLAEAARHLRDLHARVHEVASRVAADAWSVRPVADAWTPLEILEHVAVIERGTVRMVLAGLPEGAPAVDRRAS